MRIIATPNTKHAYIVGTETGRIEVHANSRAQARKLAEGAGYVVRDINMIG